MTDLTALDELIKAVEAGEFRRGGGLPPRSWDFIDAISAIGIKCRTLDLFSAFYDGDTSCADFLRAYRVKIGGAA